MRKVAICLSLAAIVFAGYTMIGVAAQGMKPAIHGLLNRNGSSIPSGYRASLAGYDVSGDATGSVGWSQLQSAPNGPITSNNPIDAAIADVDAWNAANPSAQEALKLRVTAGAQTPAWALNLGGTCVELTNPQTPSQQECIPRFWTASFQLVWYSFVAELAAKYDPAPEIAEVTMTPNMTFSAEPMIRDISSTQDVSALLAAGYSTSVDEQNQLCDIGPVVAGCAGGAIGSYWPHTTVDYTVNPYEAISASGTVSINATFTLKAIAAAHLSGLALENNSVRQAYQTGTGNYQTMYAEMTGQGPPIDYQTASISLVGALATVIQTAGQWGASSLELPSSYACPNSYNNCLTVAQVASLGAALPLPPSSGGGPTPTPSPTSTPTPTASPTPTPSPTPTATPSPTPTATPTPTPAPTPTATPSPSGPPQIVQVVSASHSAPAIAATLTLRNAGDALLVVATFGGGSTSRSGSFSVSDTLGTHFDQLASQSTVTSHGDTEIGDVYLGLPPSAAGDTVIASEPGGTGSGVLELVEISGENVGSPIDAVGSDTGGSPNITGGISVSVRTPDALTSLNDLVIGLAGFYGGGGVTHQSFSPAGTHELNEPTVSTTAVNPMSLAVSVQDAAALQMQSFSAQLAGSVAADSAFVVAISPER